MTNQFDASASASGYFYQARVALALLLESGPGSSIEIETLDDLVVNSDSSTELVQLKHIVSKNANLSDFSTNFWKTIRIWIMRLKKGELNMHQHRLTLFTNAQVPFESALHYLTVSFRNESKALDVLISVAGSSKNKEIQSYLKEYRELPKKQKEQLISLIRVLPENPNVEEIKARIERQLAISTRPKFLPRVAERVEGWWWDQVAKSLLQSDRSGLSYLSLLSYINDVQEEYHLDNLPIDFTDFVPPEKAEIKAGDRLFIEQLKLISISNPRIDKAISDYFKAFHQRTKWVEDGDLDLRHLEKYELKLKDEWERMFLEIKEDLGDAPEDGDSIKFGRKVFNDLHKRTDLNIRERCTEAYIMRGTFHILANKLEVGWHPDFRERLKELFQDVKGKLSEAMDGTPS